MVLTLLFPEWLQQPDDQIEHFASFFALITMESPLFHKAHFISLESPFYSWVSFVSMLSPSFLWSHLQFQEVSFNFTQFPIISMESSSFPCTRLHFQGQSHSFPGCLTHFYRVPTFPGCLSHFHSPFISRGSISFPWSTLFPRVSALFWWILCNFQGPSKTTNIWSFHKLLQAGSPKIYVWYFQEVLSSFNKRSGIRKWGN
jgi:hypothetical protein